MSGVAGGRRKRGWARQVAADWLEACIRSGQLAAGQRIPPEPELCALLGVGRSSVREAVQGLVAAGMLEIRPGTGTFVRSVGVDAVLSPAEVSRRLAPTGVLDLLELNLILETGIVDLAARRATDEDLMAVERTIDAGRKAVDDPDAFADSIEQYRLTLAAASHNAALVQMTAALNVLLRHRRVATAGRVSTWRRREVAGQPQADP